MIFFDTHVHFDMIKAADGAHGAVERAIGAGVTRMIAIGGSAPANEFALSMAARFPDTISAAVGYDRDCAGGDHPMPDLEPALQGLNAAGVRPVAVGEIGLDFHYHPETAEKQGTLIAGQLELARRYQLPVVVHSRQADEATLDLLGRHVAGLSAGSSRIGVIHCFTGDIAFARKVLDIGLHVSFSGIVTFRNADTLREAARFVPADRLLIETDSPFLAPVPHRGKSNEPMFVPDVAKMLAEVRGCSIEEIAGVTSRNAAALFGA
ncbi:MAG: TatD family hydrolase [bacterium]